MHHRTVFNVCYAPSHHHHPRKKTGCTSRITLQDDREKGHRETWRIYSFISNIQNKLFVNLIFFVGFCAVTVIFHILASSLLFYTLERK